MPTKNVVFTLSFPRIFWWLIPHGFLVPCTVVSCPPGIVVDFCVMTVLVLIGGEVNWVEESGRSDSFIPKQLETVDFHQLGQFPYFAKIIYWIILKLIFNTNVTCTTVKIYKYIQIQCKIIINHILSRLPTKRHEVDISKVQQNYIKDYDKSF
jgi:hypothetical protein